jgi:hypothetical protein
MIEIIGLIIFGILFLINAAALATHLIRKRRIRKAKAELEQFPEFNPPFHPMCRCDCDPVKWWDDDEKALVVENKMQLQTREERLYLDDGVLKSIPVEDLPKDMTESELIDIAGFIRKNKNEKHTRG